MTKGIKDIIAEFPGVGKILEEYGIGCGPCTIERLEQQKNDTDRLHAP